MNTNQQHAVESSLLGSIRKAGVVAVMALAAAGLALCPSANAADQVAVNDQVKDAVVNVQGTWTGWVQIPGKYMDDNTPVWIKTVAGTGCTGFVVDSTGFIATAGHCVDNTSEDIKSMMREKMFADAVKSGELTKADAVELLEIANAEQWLVEGHDRGSPIERKIQVKQPDDPDQVINEWTTVQVVQFQHFHDGDNALLKVSGEAPLTPLVISNDVPAPGETLTVVGFPGSVEHIVDEDRMPQPSFKTGTASSQQIRPNGTPMTEINADMQPGMSGGPTVDSSGEVVGINSSGFDGEVTNFITNAPALRAFLEQNGVDLAEPVTPEKPVPWMWIGVAAAAIVFALLLIGLVTMSIRTKRSTVPAQLSDVPREFPHPVTPQPGPYQQAPQWYHYPPMAHDQPTTVVPQPRTAANGGSPWQRPAPSPDGRGGRHQMVG